MLLTIYNLPNNTRFCDLRQMIQLKCNLSEVILDNLVSDGKGNKKVTVGLAEESDGAILVRKINGLFIGGNQLYVENVKQKKASEQPYHSVNAVQDVFPPQAGGMANQDQNSMMSAMTASNMGMYYMPVMPPNQSAFMSFSGQPQITPLMSQVSEPSVLERSVPNDRSRGWATGTNDRNFEVTRRPESSWQRSSYEDKRQSSSITDQRNANFGWDQKANENSGGRQPRRVQSDSVRDYPREQTNMPTPRGGIVRREGESRWELTSVPAPRDEHKRGDSRWDEPNPMTSRDNRDRPYSRSLRSPSRPSMDRYNVRSDLHSKDYEDRKVGQGNWGVDHGQQRSTHCIEPFNSNVFSVSGQTSSMFVKQGTGPDQEYSGSQKGQGPSRWDNSNKTNNRPQEFSQQRHSFNENNRPERVSRPSPRYEERDVRLSKPGDRRPDRAFNKRPLDLRSAQEPPTKRLDSQHYTKPNLSNTTFRRTSPSRPPHKEPPKPRQPGFQQNVNMKKLLHKDQTWRQQAASAIAKQTLKGMDITDMGSHDIISKKLKASIKSRIDVVLGEKVAIPMNEIMKMYRQRFHFKTDQAFFVAVLDSMKNDEENQANTYKPGVKEAEGNGVSKPADKRMPKKPAEPKDNPITGPVKLTKFPNKDKKAYIQLKQLRKQEILDENMYKLPENTQAAVDEQADILCDLFMESCETPDNEEHKKLCEKMTDVVADNFRKIIRLQLTKRLLNITSNVMVRIFAQKKVNKQKLLQFLEPYNLVSFKKSDKKAGLYVADCGDFEGFDRLCELSQTEIDGVTITIKPLHIIGPPKIIKSKLHQTRAKLAKIHKEHHTISEEPGKLQESSKVNEESLDHDAEDIHDYGQDGDQMGNERDDNEHDDNEHDDEHDDNEHDDCDQIGTENKGEGNIQDIPDMDEANEDDLEDY